MKISRIPARSLEQSITITLPVLSNTKSAIVDRSSRSRNVLDVSPIECRLERNERPPLVSSTMTVSRTANRTNVRETAEPSSAASHVAFSRGTRSRRATRLSRYDAARRSISGTAGYKRTAYLHDFLHSRRPSSREPSFPAHFSLLPAATVFNYIHGNSLARHCHVRERSASVSVTPAARRHRSRVHTSLCPAPIHSEISPVER